MIEKKSRIKIIRKVDFKLQTVFFDWKSNRAVIYFFILPSSSLSATHLEEHTVWSQTKLISRGLNDSIKPHIMLDSCSLMRALVFGRMKPITIPVNN